MLTSLFSCSTKLDLITEEVNTSKIFDQSFIGLMLKDLGSNEVLLEINSDRFFTPASNTKVLTAYTALQILADSLPLFRVKSLPDSTIIWGTGFPLLYFHNYPDSTLPRFIAQSRTPVYWSQSNNQQSRFGVGWMWDDYPTYYQSEISPLPVYGNVIELRLDSASRTFVTHPTLHDATFTKLERETSRPRFYRKEQSNDFEYILPYRFSSDTLLRPLTISDNLVKNWLHELSGKTVGLTSYHNLDESVTVYGSNLDSLLKGMLQESNNFLAEQILMLVSHELFDSLDIRRVIEYANDSLFSTFPDPPRWEDGSGLSRYNLVSPRFMIALIEDMRRQIGAPRFNNMMSVNGMAGTLKSRLTDLRARIFAKTGTLSNNHSVSGVLITDSGREIAFSFMLNHYRKPTSAMRAEMDRFLRRMIQEL